MSYQNNHSYRVFTLASWLLSAQVIKKRKYQSDLDAQCMVAPRAPYVRRSAMLEAVQCFHARGYCWLSELDQLHSEWHHRRLHVVGAV